MEKSILILLALLISSCGDKKPEIEKAMQNYDRQIFRMAADSLADCFTKSGELGGEGLPSIVSRDSIRNF